MNVESKTTRVGFRVSPSLAVVINQCVAEGGWRNKSEMLRELFSELVEQINKTEVSTVGADTKIKKGLNPEA